MKIILKSDFEHQQLKSQKTNELYSLSAVVSSLMASKQLFIHHDILKPCSRSSGAHRHSVIEEVVYVTKGSVVVCFQDQETVLPEGAFVFFDPTEKHGHYLTNKTEELAETITFSISSKYDLVIFDDSEKNEINLPTFHFDQNLKEVPDDVKAWEAILSDLQNKLKSEIHSSRRLEIIENVGMICRILQKLDEAESLLLRAVSLSCGHPSQSKYVQNLIRLAHVYQWKKEFDKSQLLFDQVKSLMDEIPVSESLLASYHQHLGKLYFDQEYYALAQSEIATALSLRMKMSVAEDQLESSRSSLLEAQSRWGRVIGSEFIIRRALPNDALGIHLAHMKSIREVCSKDHSLEEIKDWGNRPFNEDQRISAIKNDFVLVVEQQGIIEGYGHFRIFEKEGMKRGHVFGLYLSPKAIGKSLGIATVEIMIEKAKLKLVQKLTLESTITALEFYRKIGFQNDGPQITVKIGDSEVRCYPMSIEFPFAKEACGVS